MTFTYKDQETPVIEQEAVFQNERQKVEVSVVKKDAETQATVEGAVFGLYAKEDILAHGEVIVKADTLIGKALSDENGKAVFMNDLPFGRYYIKEEAAPDGYISSDKVVEVTAEYQGQEIPVVELASEYEDGSHNRRGAGRRKTDRPGSRREYRRQLDFRERRGTPD